MNIKDFFLGKYDHEFWKNRLTPLIIIEFLGTLMIAWALRPMWLDDSWYYIPFANYISGLGKGRMEGNIGAWFFMIGFMVYPIMGTAWNSYLSRKFFEVSKVYGVLIWIVFEFSLWNVALVGIFDGSWPEPGLSGYLHWFGATYSFMGHTISATLILVGVSIVYWMANSEDRNINHPFKFALILVELVGVYLIFRAFGGTFWQWMIMLSIVIFAFSTTRLFPETLKLGK
ncbi:MAG: hypothetical protein EU532_03865 [Promethearchaeota archaeon]|nr:MAG: hypothetical protein EU532_03865 [Candidatus Lokiarchaeota archaeon]